MSLGDPREAAWFGRELRVARRVAGLTQQQLGRKAGMTQTREGRIERGLLVPDLTTARRLAEAVGYSLVIKLIPGSGTRLRDSGQMDLANVIRQEAHERSRVLLEVPVGRPPDRRAADLVLETDRETTMIEIERWLVDFQAQLRSAQLKRAALAERRGHAVRLVLGVPDLPRARAACAPHLVLIRETLPTSSRHAWAAIRSGAPIGGDALLWIRSRPRYDRTTKRA